MKNNSDPNDTNFEQKLSHIQHAAQVLRLALVKWATPVNQLKLQTYKALREYLNDPKSSWASQYGSLTALIHLGPEALVECLLPQLDRYLTSIEAKMTQSTRHHCHRLQLMYGTLLLASRKILAYLTQRSKCEEDKFVVYSMMAKHFADALYLPSSLPDGQVPTHTPTHTIRSSLRIRALPQNMPRFDIFEDSFLTNGFESSKILFSRSVKEQFECVNLGIEANAKIHFKVRSFVVWSEDRLQRKPNLSKRYHPGQYRSFPGCIGKRLGVQNQRRQKTLCLSSIANIVI